MFSISTLMKNAMHTLGNNIFSRKYMMSLVAILVIMGILSGAMLVLMPIFTIMMLPTLMNDAIGFAADLSVSSFYDLESFYQQAGEMYTRMFISLLPYILIMFVVVAILIIFLIGPMGVGLLRYFLANRDPYDKTNPKISLIFSCFKNGQYIKIVKTIAWYYLFIFLWSIIPIVGPVFSTIKGIQYAFTLYLVADNPDIGYRRALNLSKQMTKGFKWKIFLLILCIVAPFIGAYLIMLGLGFAGNSLFLIPIITLLGFALWIAYFFVIVFAAAVMTELYDNMKKYSIAQQILTPADIGFDVNGDPRDPFWQPFDLNNPYLRNFYYTRMANSRPYSR